MSNTTEVGIEGTEADHSSFEGAVAYQALEAQGKPKEPELSAATIEDIALKFEPQTEVDQDGLTRQIYKFGEVSFSFSGREETPIYPSIENSRPTHLGHESWWLNHEPNQDAPLLSESEVEYYKECGFTEENIAEIQGERFKEWDDERQRLTNYEPTLANLRNQNTTKPEHFIAEESPYGVYLLLSKLQPENSQWLAQAEAISQNNYDQEAIDLIDMITAVNSYYLEQNTEAKHRPPIGEVVVVAAMMGDKSALDIAGKAVGLQRDKEQEAANEALESILSTKLPADVEAFKPSELAVVHATKYEPQETADGFNISTTHDASGFPRATIHTSLNHKVMSHMYGEWDDKDYIIIAGLDQALGANGTPKSLNGADTWWTRNPGEPLSLPGATLIMPGGNQNELIINAEHGRRKYKSEGIKHEDIERADDIRTGLTATIIEALKDENGKAIPVNSPHGQRIVANILRDVLVQQEITIARGLKIEAQDDDKFMPSDFNQKVYKMAAELKLPITGALHADSDEAWVEKDVSKGDQIFSTPDPKVRRVAYASGFISTGGDARQEYIKRKSNSIPGD